LVEGILYDVLTEKKNIVSVIILTVIASLGVNLLAYGILQLTYLNFNLMLVLGTGLIIISILYFVIIMLSKRKKTKSYNGLFVVDNDNRHLIPVNRYKYSEKLSSYFEAAFAENQDIKRIWDKSFEKKSQFKTHSEEETIKLIKEFMDRPERQLVKEATEYFVLNALSLHLSTYFNDAKFKEENLQKLERKHISNILPQNRFLDLISKPMPQRAAFIDECRSPNNIVTQYSKSGAVYNRFELVLPKNTSVSRPNQDTIQIDTAKFVLSIVITYAGLSELLPHGFGKYYLGIDVLAKAEAIQSKVISININVSFKFGTFLSNTGIQYYHWVDSFLNELEKDFSSEFFFKTIGWDNAVTVIEYLDKHNNLQKAEGKHSS
jgi:hypothetical protein